jgi:hypothetical protein
MKIFTGGSRQLSKLNNVIRQGLEDVLTNDPLVLIGDASGSDKAIQQYLSEKKYKKVHVFCSGAHCRNNLGEWEVHRIQSARNTKDFSFYAAKDEQMAVEADCGFMLWDGKSKGTLNNILNLLERGKKVSVYFSPKRIMINLLSTRDLAHLLKCCDRTSLDYFDKTIRVNQRLHAGQGQLSFV